MWTRGNLRARKRLQRLVEKTQTLHPSQYQPTPPPPPVPSCPPLPHPRFASHRFSASLHAFSSHHRFFMAPPEMPPRLCQSSHEASAARVPDHHFTIPAMTSLQASLGLLQHDAGADSSLYHYHRVARELPFHHNAPMLNPRGIKEALLTTKGSPPAPRLFQRPMVEICGRFPIRRILDPTSRQVTFSKRRNGLLKKAYELSVLCDVEVGLIVFSAAGRLHEFAYPSMQKVLERYQEHQNGLPSCESLLRDIEFWKQGVSQLRDQISYQQNLQSYMLGENLLPLDVNELQTLEHKLDVALNKIKLQKAQLIRAEAEELRTREARLKEENDLLRRKLSEVTNLYTSKQRMVVMDEARRVPCLGGDVMRSSIHQSSPPAGEHEFPSTCFNHDVDEHLRLQLGLELFPIKPMG